jgi:SAM-dependent methyltransferase
MSSVESAPAGAATTTATLEPASDHANEAWWKEHGGAEWWEEFQRRKLVQGHYHQQETFLQGFFLGMPPVRVLDFGCGFGRHLRNLRQLPWLDLFGCDISPKMVEMTRQQLGFADGEERIRQIEPRGRLPFEDAFFDVVFTSEVLIHVDLCDLATVLDELWRVSRSLILHIENSEVHASFRENDAHDGCWRHDFRRAYAAFPGAEVLVLPAAVDLQTVYLVSKPTSVLGHAADSRAQAALEVAARSLKQWRRQFAEQTLHLGATQSKLEEANRNLQKMHAPPSRTLLSRLRMRLPSAPSLRAEGPPLPYRRFATRGSVPPEEFLADQPAVISICHPDWRGIRAATQAQARHVLEIPGIFSEAQCARAVRFIAESGTRRVVINGFPPGVDRLAVQIKIASEEVKIYFVYHGAPAQDHHREDLVIQRMLALADTGHIEKIGFVKSGLAEYFQTLGYPAEHLANRFSARLRQASATPRQGNRFHIGVFSPLVSHKNVVTQVLAALMIPDSIVEVCEMPRIEYLEQSRDRIVVHGILPHDSFMDVLSQVDASLYVSHSECYPMTVLESLAAGVVCLTSDTSPLFDGAEELFRALVVPRHDNPLAISEQLQRALDRRLELIPLAQARLKLLDEQAEARWRRFIAA